MNTTYSKFNLFSRTILPKKVVLFFLLVPTIIAIAKAQTVQASLPPETYYQGIDTGVNGDDVGSDALPIGFDFTFFGNTYHEFYVSSNGYISFDDRDLTDYVNVDIDHPRNPDNYIAPFWDDTTVYNGSGEYVYYKTLGTAPNRQLVVQYTNIGFWNDPTPLGTFSIILFEGSNNIQFQYRYLVGNSSVTHGGSATIGLENRNGSAGTKYAFNTESLSSEQVILFTPNGDNYDIGTAPYAGILLGAGATPSPDIPVQTAPVIDATTSQTPTFSWEPSANADSYELRIDNDANMGSLILNPTEITGTTFTPEAPLPVDNYYWIVIAHNENDSTWSEQWVFAASDQPPTPLPDTPILSDPGQNETDVSTSPTFSWETAANAADYQLLVSEQSDLSAPVVSQSEIISPTTSFEAAGLQPDTTYFWAVVANNETGGSQSATQSFTTLHVNQAPTANNDSFSVVEDSAPAQLDVLANDSDPDTSDTLSITTVSTPDSGGTAVLNNNQIDYSPAVNFSGSETFTYDIADGQGGSDSGTVTVQVTAVNDEPIANDDTASVPDDAGPILIDVLANDVDQDSGDVLVIDSVSQPDSGGTAVINNSQIEYTSSPPFVGTETFTYTVRDNLGATATAQVTVNVYVSSSNAAPNGFDDSPETLEDESVIIDVLANDNDPDGDSLSILAIGTALHGTAVIQDNRIKYTPDVNFYGSDSFSYTLGDGEFTDTATVNITIVPVNDLPQAAQDIADTTAGSSVMISVLENDSDPVEGNTLMVTSVEDPAHGTATTDGTTIFYVPDPGFIGTETFTYTLSDGSDSVTGNVTVTINPYQVFIPSINK